jgi:hypothetical protein
MSRLKNFTKISSEFIRNMTDFDYKKYSLENLENWLHDALSSAEASPHEIYSTIRKVVQDEYNYHKEQSQRCFGLLELMSGHRPVDLSATGEPFTCDKDDPSPECKSAWNDFWEIVEKEAPDRVKTWRLPVEEVKDFDTDETEYFISFPDDLLEAANISEGDQIEWIDNDDGSFTLKKVDHA